MGADSAGTQPTITRADVAALVDSLADAGREVFGPDADPGELNTFFKAMRLRVEFDAVA